MKIALVTGSRAEYGLLERLAYLINEHDDLRLIVTGSHLSNAHGNTIDQIEVPIARTIECVLSSDTPNAVGKSVSLAVAGFSDYFTQDKPEVVILLGDRYEILAAAIAAHIHRAPICHLHGGEITAGAYDDSFRHSITKMASLHFVAAEEYRNRVIQLGEDPSTVFNVGALGTEWMICRKEQPNKKQCVVIYHPETLRCGSQVYGLVSALKRFPGLYPIFIRPNADNGSNEINEFINYEIGRNEWGVTSSLKRDEFHQLLSESDFMIGNSSAGIIEAPALGVPTINIGKRQKGRLRASSIIDVEHPTTHTITDAITQLYSPEFQASLSNIHMPYGKGKNISERILGIIKSTKFNLMKGFYDLTP